MQTKTQAARLTITVLGSSSADGVGDFCFLGPSFTALPDGAPLDRPDFPWAWEVLVKEDSRGGRLGLIRGDLEPSEGVLSLLRGSRVGESLVSSRMLKLLAGFPITGSASLVGLLGEAGGRGSVLSTVFDSR